MKDSTNQQVARREFLKRTSQAAAGAVLAGGAIQARSQEKSGGEASAIPVRTLGKTGLKLPILGYGGAALPKAWLNPLSHEDRVKLVRYAYDKGIRYFDTAGNYLES